MKDYSRARRARRASHAGPGGCRRGPFISATPYLACFARLDLESLGLTHVELLFDVGVQGGRFRAEWAHVEVDPVGEGEERSCVLVKRRRCKRFFEVDASWLSLADEPGLVLEKPTSDVLLLRVDPAAGHRRSSSPQISLSTIAAISIQTFIAACHAIALVEVIAFSQEPGGADGVSPAVGAPPAASAWRSGSRRLVKAA